MATANLLPGSPLLAWQFRLNPLDDYRGQFNSPPVFIIGDRLFQAWISGFMSVSIQDNGFLHGGDDFQPLSLQACQQLPQVMDVTELPPPPQVQRFQRLFRRLLRVKAEVLQERAWWQGDPSKRKIAPSPR